MAIDGNKRPRRNLARGKARKRWYAYHRNSRFAARFGNNANSVPKQLEQAAECGLAVYGDTAPRNP